MCSHSQNTIQKVDRRERKLMRGLHGLLHWDFCGRLALEPTEICIFALTSLSLRDLPLLYDIIGGFEKIVISKGWFLKVFIAPSKFLLHQNL